MEGERCVVFFDGDCLLCSRTVQWCHRADKYQRVWFAALEGKSAAAWREEFGLPEGGEGAETFVFLNEENGRVSSRSEGVVELLKTLGGIHAGIGVMLGWVPRSLRDWGYGIVARNRRQWFGSAENCPVPPGSLQGRVLE